MLCVVGLIFPYSQFAPWLVEHGLNVGLLVQEATLNRVAAFAWADVLVTAVTVLVFIFVEGVRRSVRPLWLPAVATLIVGPSLGLPLFLLVRTFRNSSNQGSNERKQIAP